MFRYHIVPTAYDQRSAVVTFTVTNDTISIYERVANPQLPNEIQLSEMAENCIVGYWVYNAKQDYEFIHQFDEIHPLHHSADEGEMDVSHYHFKLVRPVLFNDFKTFLNTLEACQNRRSFAANYHLYDPQLKKDILARYKEFSITSPALLVASNSEAYQALQAQTGTMPSIRENNDCLTLDNSPCLLDTAHTPARYRTTFIGLIAKLEHFKIDVQREAVRALEFGITYGLTQADNENLPHICLNIAETFQPKLLAPACGIEEVPVTKGADLRTCIAGAAAIAAVGLFAIDYARKYRASVPDVQKPELKEKQQQRRNSF